MLADTFYYNFVFFDEGDDSLAVVFGDVFSFVFNAFFVLRGVSLIPILRDGLW